jgi:hypothetical protein
VNEIAECVALHRHDARVRRRDRLDQILYRDPAAVEVDSVADAQFPRQLAQLG